MSVLAGGSESNTDEVNRDVTANDQSVLWHPIKSNNQRNNYRGATFTTNVTQGIGAEDFQTLLASLPANVGGPLNDGLPGATGTDIAEDAVLNRATEQIADAPNEEKKFTLGTWILIAVVVLILGGLGVFKLRKKKAP